MMRQLTRVLSCVAVIAQSHAQQTQPAPTASPTPQSLVANESISLVTKTPLGDAALLIAPGTALTNFEVQGDQVKVSQGPFSAIVELAEVQPSAASAASPDPSTTPVVSPPPSPSPTNTPEEPIAPAPEASPASTEAGVTLPSWVLPAVCGVLAAYAAFATLALLGSRRKSAPAARAKAAASTPVVTLTSKPAVVADEGRAIACPHCGKNIPLEKVVKGRNRCPSCDGNFVGE